MAAHGAVFDHGGAIAPPARLRFAGSGVCGALQCGQIDLHQHHDPAKALGLCLQNPWTHAAINLFALGRQAQTDAVLADLPGYGYAAVPKQDKIRWQQVMANYLMTRPNLKGIVLLCDPRLGLTELDEILLDIMRPRVMDGLQFLVLLTKADKLNRTDAQKALSITRLQAGGGEVQLFSALKRQGLDEVALKLWQWTHPKVKASEPSTTES